MDISKYFVAAPPITPVLNIGCLQDIPTGKYYKGRHGEHILMGGLSRVEAVGGRGNMGKSTLLFFRLLTAFRRYRKSLLNPYDTEDTLKFPRLNTLYQSINEGMFLDLEETGRVLLTNNTVMTGNKWFLQFNQMAEDKKKNAKSMMGVTPFIHPKTGQNVEMIYPSLFGVDSLSQLMTDNVEEIFGKNEVGDSKANTVYMRGGNAKTQMLMQLPTITGQSNMFITLSMHVGDKIQMDQYNPNPKLLADMKADTSFKNVPKNVTFLTNNLWYVFNSTVLQHRETKTPLYPIDSSSVVAGDTDLRIMQLQNLRAKNGPTGMPFELVWSQRDGILAGLSEYNFLKTHERYGIGGNDRTFYLELLPEVSLMRTTIRGKIDNDRRLRRALEITSEMLQMQLMWRDEHDVFCSPAELRADLEKLGYDWDVLLSMTRGYWMFEDEAAEEPLQFLSTMDLLRMRKGLYIPYWKEIVNPYKVDKKKAG